jgi:hypothetical protein
LPGKPPDPGGGAIENAVAIDPSIPNRVRVTLFADHSSGDATDFKFILAWIEKWRNDANVSDYSTGGWEHIWDVDASRDAIAEIPKRFFCMSEWANYPQPLGGAEDPFWSGHLDDGKK